MAKRFNLPGRAAVAPVAVALLLLAGSALGVPPGSEPPMQEGLLKVGDRAPMFPAPLPSTAGERPGARQIALEDVLGTKNIVLAFYVADWTGG